MKLEAKKLALHIKRKNIYILFFKNKMPLSIKYIKPEISNLPTSYYIKFIIEMSLLIYATKKRLDAFSEPVFF
ncbi:TPA: hypothetical protein MHS33_26645 [Klebsiella pneumoniae]|nr:hypothetical protein [Klebsiella pneumoniae]